ncbi:hypothetical protein B0H14DRAFT_2876759 [Mycena olivaceomarginata]|nr:hypothetical protein B0H14DRAFT_2876759 [Mycena olivaceomarginata]
MPPSLDLTKTFGALLIGVIVSAALYGVTCIQTFYYFTHYHDGWWAKILIAVLWIFETVHSIFSCHAIYWYVITNYANPAGLARATWSAVLTLLVSSIIMLLVHLFYAKRVWHMSRKNRYLTSLIVVLAITHALLGVGIASRAFQLQYFVAFSQITGLVDSSLALAVITDVLVAASLSYYLHTSRSGIERTDTLINRLLVYTINNGILTSIFDIITLVFVTAEVDNLIYLAVFQVVGNLYTNSMMATLNSRKPTMLTAEDVNLSSSIRLTPGGTTVNSNSSVVNTLQDQHKMLDVRIAVSSTTESTELERSKSGYIV